MVDFSIDADLGPFNSKMAQAESRLNDFEDKSNAVIDTVDKGSKISFNKVLGLARLGWSAFDQVFQALGINLGEQVRLLIQAGFSAVSALQSIFTAEASNPYTAVFGIASLFELEFAVMALILAQSGQQQLAMKTAQTARAIFSVGNVINGISFLR